MSVKINGSTLTLQPSRMNWVPRTTLGDSGKGNPIYAGPREFTLEWDLVNPSMFNELQNFYNALGLTGTAVVELPRYGFATYTFFAYTGCVVREPEMEEFFNEHQANISLLITNIIT
jgi:hypothetical protein